MTQSWSRSPALQAVPIILVVGAGGAFLLYRASQTEDGKTLKENAKKQAQQFEQAFSAGKVSSFTNFDGKGKVIDIEMDGIPDEETPEEREFRLKRRAVESDLSDFDNRLRGRWTFFSDIAPSARTVFYHS